NAPPNSRESNPCPRQASPNTTQGIHSSGSPCATHNYSNQPPQGTHREDRGHTMRIFHKAITKPLLSTALVALAAVGLAAPAQAAWPEKPIRIMVPAS